MKIFSSQTDHSLIRQGHGRYKRKVRLSDDACRIKRGKVSAGTRFKILCERTGKEMMISYSIDTNPFSPSSFHPAKTAFKEPLLKPSRSRDT